jgi:hypothetical protein
MFEHSPSLIVTSSTHFSLWLDRMSRDVSLDISI